MFGPLFVPPSRSSIHGFMQRGALKNMVQVLLLFSSYLFMILWKVFFECGISMQEDGSSAASLCGCKEENENMDDDIRRNGKSIFRVL